MVGLFLPAAVLIAAVLVAALCFKLVRGDKDSGAGAVIWTPRGHNPAFAEPGGTLEVEVRASGRLPLKGWRAELKNDLRSWDASVVSVRPTRVCFGLEEGYIFTVRVPEDISQELFDLVLKSGRGKALTSARCLSVRGNLEEDFYILHLTDEHVSRVKAARPDGRSHEFWDNGSIDMIDWSVPVVNLINPRFVLHTGDNQQTYNEWNNWLGMEAGRQNLMLYMKAKSKYAAPTVMVTGNHEIGYTDYIYSREWRDAYEEIVGSRCCSIRMGSFYLLAYEWTYDEFLSWARDNYHESFKDESVKYRLLASHYFDGMDAPTTVAGADKPCDLLLVGHNHKDSILQTAPYPVISNTTSQVYMRSTFYGFINKGDRWTCPQAEDMAEDYRIALFGDWGENPIVKAEFERDNDGTQTENRAVVTNTVGINFFDGRLRFLMTRGFYKAEGGEILSQYPYGGDKTCVLVRVDIQPAREEASRQTVAVTGVADASSLCCGD